MIHDYKNKSHIVSNKRLVIGHYSLTYFGKSPFSVCIIEIDGQSLSNSFSSPSQTLAIWLFSTSLLDLDITDTNAEYPIAPKATNIKAYGLNSGQTISSYNRLTANNSLTGSNPSPNTILEKIWFGTVGNYFHATKTSAPFDTRKSMYQFYLGSVIYITFQSTPSNNITMNSTTTPAAATTPPLLIPVYCPQFSNINSTYGSNGTAFAHPVVIISWLDMSSYTSVNNVTKILMDGSINSMNKFTNTPSASPFKTSSFYARTIIGLYKGGTNTLAQDNVTVNQFATSIEDNVKYATLRFSAYYPSFNPNNELLMFSGTSSATTTGTINCSGMSFLLNKDLSYEADSSKFSTTGLSGINLYSSTITTGFYVNGVLFDKLVLGVIPPVYSLSSPVTYTPATPHQFNNLSTTTIPAISNYKVTAIIRPNIKSFSNNGVIDLTNKLGFFCTNNLLIEDPTLFKNNIIIMSNFVFENTPSDNNITNFDKLHHFIMDTIPVTSPWLNISIMSDSDEVYKADPAGNMRSTFTLPTEIPIGSQINFIGNGALVYTETLCGLETIKGGIVSECITNNVTVTCTVPNSSQLQTFSICCYNVKFSEDDVSFLTANVSLPHLPKISKAQEYLNKTLYTIDTSIASPFLFKTYQSTARDINTSISATISDIKYGHVNQDSGLGMVTFTIVLSRPLVRNMEIRIVGDISSFIVPKNSPRCFASFTTNNSFGDFSDYLDSNWDSGNVLLETCGVSNLASITNPVVIRTKKIIYKCGLTMNNQLKVRLWPIIITNWTIDPFNKLKFKVLTRLITTGSFLSSTNTDFVMPYFDKKILQKPLSYNIWDTLCPITLITPRIAGEYADYTFSFNITIYKQTIQKANLTPNELSLFFPFSYYGNLTDNKNIYCLYQGILVNCAFTLPSILNLRIKNLSLDDFSVVISGIKNPEVLSSSPISIPCGVNYTDYATDIRYSILTGSGSLNQVINMKSNQQGALFFINKISNVLENPSPSIPRQYSTHTFKIGIDYANGLTNNFNSPLSPIMMITFPADYNLPWYKSDLENQINATIDEYRLNTTSTKNNLPILTRNVKITKTTIIGNRIDIYYDSQNSFSYDYADTTFLYFIITINNVPNPLDSTKTSPSLTTDSYSITFTDSDYFMILKTFSNSNNIHTELLQNSPNQYLLYSKGFKFEFPEALWVVDVIDKKLDVFNKIIINNGRYMMFYFKIKANTSKLIFLKNNYISLSHTTFKLKESKYEMQTSFFKEVPFQLGCACKETPGTYLIKFDSTDKIIFAFMAIIQTSLDNFTKGVISYSGNDSIRIAGSGFIYYSLSEPNYDDMVVTWNPAPNSANDGTAKISSVNIKASDKINYTYRALFSITSGGSGIQSFISDSPNNCYNWDVNVININVQNPIAVIPNSAISIDNFTYYNYSLDTDISINSIRLSFKSDFSNMFIFCALVCVDISFQADKYIKDPITIPDKDKVPEHLISFSEFNVISSDPVDLIFNNLLRGSSYKLKCIVESVQGDNRLRTSSIIESSKPTKIGLKDQLTNETFNSFTPTNTLPSRCVIFTFDSDPGASVKDSLRNRLQKYYSQPLGYFENGCIMAVDQYGSTINGLEFPVNNTCGSNNYLFHPKTADSDPLLTSVGKVEEYYLCAVQNPLCKTNVIDNKFDETFDIFQNELNTPSDFISVLNITAIRAFKKSDSKDVAPPDVTNAEISKISDVNGVFSFNISNKQNLGCYYKLNSNSTQPSNIDIVNCKTNECGFLLVDQYGVDATVNLGPVKVTTTFFLYIACYNDVPFPQKLSKTFTGKTHLVEVKLIPDIGFNASDPLNITTKGANMLRSKVLLLLILLGIII